MRLFHRRFRSLPTPMAGLALGVASLGWCLENALPLHGYGQIVGAVIASCLLGLLVVRFICHFDTLWADLKHPVVGSIVPTFAMALMVIRRRSAWLCPIFPWAMVLFRGRTFVRPRRLCFHRLRDPNMAQMVPSWFIPPVGIIVADVTFPGVPELLPLRALVVGDRHDLLCHPVAAHALPSHLLDGSAQRSQAYDRHHGGTGQPLPSWLPHGCARAQSASLRDSSGDCRSYDDRHLLRFLEPSASTVLSGVCGLHLPDGDRCHRAL